MKEQVKQSASVVVDPRLLQLVALFKLCDERGKQTLLRMAAVMPKGAN